MKQWKIGVLGASDIAYKRFLPALKKSNRFSFVGIASRDQARCLPFIEKFGGRRYPDYNSLLQDSEIDCIYLPLPPALHACWGVNALHAGKHLLMEKPFTTSLSDTRGMLDLAERLDLTVYENYMFLYHRQLAKIKEIIKDGELGELRMVRAAFTFPFRGESDFRYKPELGGGALLDCGGYPLLLACELLGQSTRLQWSDLYRDHKLGVDTAGSVVLQNEENLTAHVFFGMDDTYRCELEVWGSKGSLTAPRIFTAPPDLSLSLRLRLGNEERIVEVAPDDQFFHSIQFFAEQLENADLQIECRKQILWRGELIDQIQKSVRAK